MMPRHRRTERSRILWFLFGVALFAALIVGVLTFAVQPTIWDQVFNGANI